MLPGSQRGPGHPGALRSHPDEARTVAPNAFLAFSPCDTRHAQGRGGPRPDKALVVKPQKQTLCPEPPERPLPHLVLHWRQDATRKQSPPRRGREAARNPRVRRASGPGAGVQVIPRNFHPMLHFPLKTSWRKSGTAVPASSPPADVCATWASPLPFSFTSAHPIPAQMRVPSSPAPAHPPEKWLFLF